MKKLKSIFGLGFTVVGLSSGCTTFHDRIFLRSMDLHAPLFQIPVHISDGRKRTEPLLISTSFSSNSTEEITGAFEPEYQGVVPDTLDEFRRKGLHWNLPRVTFGLGLDYAISDRSALLGGVSAQLGSGRRVSAAYFGYGYFKLDTSGGFRWDIGIQFLNTSYTAASVVVQMASYYGLSEQRDVRYFLDKGEKSFVNVFVSLTMNSAKPSSFMNWFFQLAVSPQTLASFSPGLNFDPNYTVDHKNAESSVFWASLTPGVTFALTETSRALLGLRLMTDLQFDSAKSPAGLILPVIQIDWIF